MSGHVIPVRFYILICAVLLFLTWLTVWVAFIDLGNLNTVVAIGIAISKATLVLLYFMHVRYSSRLVTTAILCSILFLLILFGFTLSDYLTRGWMGA
jgi:cytochrome c oxidase subunit 4